MPTQFDPTNPGAFNRRNFFMGDTTGNGIGNVPGAPGTARKKKPDGTDADGNPYPWAHSSTPDAQTGIGAVSGAPAAAAANDDPNAWQNGGIGARIKHNAGVIGSGLAAIRSFANGGNTMGMSDADYTKYLASQREADRIANTPFVPGPTASGAVPSATTPTSNAVNAGAGGAATSPAAATSSASTPAGALPVAPVIQPAAASFNFDNGSPVSVDQLHAWMAANGALPKTPPASSGAAPGIDTGVTLPDGRKLPFGAMVNGVPTFSDGSGGFGGHPASISRTMTDADIKGLGDQLNIVPASAFTAPVPAFNSDNTDANVAAILRSRQGGKFGVTPEMNAQADLASIVNADPRSTLGRAALNLQRRAAAATTVKQREQALAQLAAFTGAGTTALGQTINGQTALQRQGLANTGAVDAENARGQFGLQEARARNAGAVDAENARGLWSLYNTIMTPRTGNAAAENAANTNDFKLATQLMGLDPAGQITDAKTGKPRAPTLADWQTAMQQARALYARQATGAAGATTTPTASAAAPAVGAVVKGYQFKGGDPAQQSNWEKVNG